MGKVVGFKVGLLGLGTVGAGVAQILLDATGRSPLLQELELYRVGARSLDKPRPVEIPREKLTTDLQSIVTDPAVDIVVEVIGGLEPARTLMLEAIRHGKHVVTANKAAIARFGPELFDAAKEAGVYLMLEAAVGGGIPIIQPLKQSLGGDRLDGITGIINGTTNYILSRMTAEGADFGDVLADAQRLGYAEADPTADVDGLDAADKIAILASLAFGGRIKREAVHAEGIRSITATDIAYADKLGFAIKLLAIARRQGAGVSLRVHPTLVPQSHPLARVDGAFNAIFVEGQPIGQVMFFGPGAGSGPTASAVVSDVLNVAAAMGAAGDRATPVNPMLSCSHNDFCDVAPLDDLETRFYVRFLTSDR
ncbi:MAG TPA: homoserine dehydrogenase, partial [Coleofasciculaceae cyanobacterium]